MKYLTMEDIEKFKQDGFLVKKNFFDENEISEIRKWVYEYAQKSQKIGRKDKKWDITKLA